MIARPPIKVQAPIIHMHMLRLRPSLLQRVANENMIELFVLVVEHIGVSLDRVDFRDFVDVGKDVGVAGVHGAGLDEFVVVPGDDDVRLFVQGEDGLDEVLWSEGRC